MSDPRVPVRANIWENLNLGTPDEDQPRPIIDGTNLSLVYDLSGFEEQNGVLVRRQPTVTVSEPLETEDARWRRTIITQDATATLTPGGVTTETVVNLSGGVSSGWLNKFYVRVIGTNGGVNRGSLEAKIGVDFIGGAHFEYTPASTNDLTRFFTLHEGDIIRSSGDNINLRFTVDASPNDVEAQAFAYFTIP